jgi:AcrR family transcriptional regulator
MTSIYSAISLILLVWLVFFAYQAYRVDKLRQDLFTIRDELFDAALDGKISVDDQAYKVSRQMMNGMIRFAHRLSIPSLFAFAVLMPSSRSTIARQSINELLNSAKPESRELVLRYLTSVNQRVIEHVATSPLFVATVFVPVLTVALTRLGFDISGLVLRSFKSAFQILDNTAYAQGANA